ncbi:MAG: protein kinase [Deltaproteobacteria bacterium]
MLNDTYEIREVLGAGGMGQVFEAHDHSLERRVAIKASWPHLEAPPLRKEAQALAAFKHPSLLTIHTMGRHRGIEYLVMERVYGVTLGMHIDNRIEAGGRFETDEVLDVLIPVAEGLSVVHRAGIAHRDLKPNNVMLSVNSRVVLLDFGLVLPEYDMPEQDHIAGSPHYIAPEVVLNEVRAGAGNLVDLYALGVTGYELLAGEPPFVGDTASEILDAHVRQPVPDVRTLRPDVPESLATLLIELLAKSPADRPQSADELACTLRIIRRGGRPSRPAAAPAARPFHVLVVEDNADMQRVLSFYVKKAAPDAIVGIAENGEDALESMRNLAPDVMLLDLQMPRMNGIEVCMYLRGTGLAPDCTIVSVSAGAQERDLQLMHELGIRHFVRKGAGLGEAIVTLVKAARVAPRAE